MKKKIAACAGMLVCLGCASAAELAYTVRPTEVKAKPFSDASTVASLAESSKVDVLQRKASWIEVKAPSATGWVKMLSLRFDQLSSTPKPGGASSSLGVLFNIAQTGSGGSVASTGVKGINVEALKNPRPNPEALKQMEDLHVSDGEVQAFAKAGKLSSATMAYVAAPGEQK